MNAEHYAYNNLLIYLLRLMSSSTRTFNKFNLIAVITLNNLLAKIFKILATFLYEGKLFNVIIIHFKDLLISMKMK